jgi:hypothetical protein
MLSFNPSTIVLREKGILEPSTIALWKKGILDANKQVYRSPHEQQQV